MYAKWHDWSLRKEALMGLSKFTDPDIKIFPVQADLIVCGVNPESVMYHFGKKFSCPGSTRFGKQQRSFGA